MAWKLPLRWPLVPPDMIVPDPFLLRRLACLALATALGLVAPRPALARGEPDAAQVKRIAPPPWVERFAPDLFAPATTDDASDGVRTLLHDEQIHAAEQTTFRHFAVRYLSQDGIQNQSTLSLSFDPGYEALRLHQLVVHRDGHSVDRLPRQAVKILQREANMEDQLYDGRLTATLILEDIRVGDVVEYAYSLHGRNPLLGAHFVTTFPAGWRDPLPRWRERLLWPARLPAPAIQNHAATCVPTIRPLDGGKTLEYRWEADNVPGRPYESDTPPWVDTYGWVQISDFASWQEVARWATRLFAQAGGDPHQELPTELQQATDRIRALPDRAAQAVAALRYVQDNYRYLGIEIGANTHQPFPIATVCERRFGDCKDKANLLSTLLRRLGFEADPALVETSYRRAVADWHPTPFAFDHAVVRLRLDGQTYWLDATREHQGGTLGHLFFADYGRALVVREDTQALAEIAPGGFQDAGVEIADDYEQAEYTGPTTLSVRSTLHGKNADRLRAYLAGTNREKVEREYLNFYAREHPKIRSLGRMEVADDRDRNELVTRERYEIADLWGKDNDPSSPRVGATFRASEARRCLELPATRLRTMPFALTLPERVTETIRLHLPGASEIKPRQVEVSDPAFRFNYRSRLEADGRTILLTYQYEATANVVEAARVPEYLAHADQALDHFGYSLTVDRKQLTGEATAAAHPLAAKRAAAPKPPAALRPSARFPWLGMVVLPLAFLVVWLQRLLPRRTAASPGGQLPPPLPLHRCAVCGRTEHRHPELDFRVGADGQDYCQDHARASSAAPVRG